MHLHQVLTGAVNPGDCCYSVGSVIDIPFTAYGSGCDVVILASDFECVQIIPGAQNGNIQVGCVECSHQLGRIAASYGNTVCIFEPLTTNPNKRHKQLNYQWQKTGQFFLDAITYNLAWDPQGNRILAATERLQLWAPPLTDALIEEEDGQLTEDRPHPVLNDWNCVWQCKTAASIHIAKWSPDGEYFATVGKDDCLLKVWYPTTGWRSAVVVQDHSDKKPAPVHFSFVYLAHPRSVTGMSWRKTSKYMPKGSVCNVLLTSCEDGVCRLWSETLLPEDSLLGGQISENTQSFSSSLPGLAGNKDKIQHALESIHHLKHLRRGRRRSSALVAHSELLPSQLSTQDTHTHRHIVHHANALCHFHISASINPNTDIPSVLADSTIFNPDDGTGGGGFVVHWLNNKDLSFTSSMDLFMLQLRKFSEQQLEQTSEDPLDMEGSPLKFDFELDEMSDKASSEHGEEVEPGEQGSTKASSPGSSSSLPLPSMLLERKMETLTTEWNKSPDMLFTIHPTDGSFLVWHVKYLDEFNQGIFRQVQVSFSSRIPVAFPTGDANSLSKNILMYACTLSEGRGSGAGEQEPRLLQHVSHSASASVNLGSALNPSSYSHPGTSPAVMMVSKHVDGSLNQWAVTFAERSAFSNVLTVSHNFRYCGHRFHLNDQACHTVLPLLLTSSHHNALLTPPSAPGSMEGEQPPTFPLPKGLPRKQLRNAATRTFHDPNAIYSELILWRVDHIGPLSCTGGVSELARINSLHTSAFSNVAWLPTLIPSSVLGTYCNSASACFVASDGKNLRLYQAVVDARKLLDELSDPETSKLVGEVFNIVSQQSTARPGCIIELDAITNQCGTNTQLLHVFQEDFILGYKPQKEEASAFTSGDDFQPPPFSEKFFLVVIEKDLNRNSVLQMWHLHLKSVQACVDEPSPDYSFQSQLLVPNQAVNPDSSPETSPVRPLPRSASSANLQSASKLILSSRLVYSKRLDLPHGVEVTRATPSAGHLSSSSIYPVCLAPYLIVTTCSDTRVRFWRCAVECDDGFIEEDQDNRVYRWEPWALMNEEEDNNSAVCMSGRPVAVSCSYIGRLAVAFKKPRQVQLHGSSEDFSMHVSIYECESTGGSEWVLEQTVHLDDFTRPSSTLDPRVSVDSNLFVYSRSDLYMSRDHSSPNIKHYVHLDWLSKEDGSHILTVGVGSNILMYGRISGMVNEQTSSKEGVAVITLPLGGSIKQGIRSRWILLRSIDLLSSVDGTPSLPVSLSWVRDGILVVGMDCEMHVYAQWHQDKKPGEGEEGNAPAADISAAQNAGSSSVFEGRARSKSVFEGSTAVDEALRAPSGLQEGGLFEAAHSLSPTLPQYHPTQLLELMDLGKVRRAKAILAHLVKCIAGEVAVVRDVEAGEGGARRHLSRTISVTGSTAKDTIVAGRDGGRDYTEINSIPPLPLYSLMLADLDTSYKGAEEATKGTKVADGEGAQKSTEDQYSDLFQVPTVTTDDFVNFAADKPEKKSRVINLSQYGPTYFGPEHAQVLSSHLMHSSLPGLTRLEQMFLVALADTVATTNAEVSSSTDQKYSGAEALDECGLRYLLAMRLHTCLLTSLPPLYRMQLLHQGLSTCHFAWAFHSEAEEELLNMIPAMQRGDPQWSELRAVGVGWWIRNINTLRKMVEKLGKAAFQRHNDPLDAALFYLAMKKKAVLWGLFRSQHDEKMTQFFKNNFSEDRWRKAALKNAFSLLGKQRFEQSAAFFLLAGSLKDAIEVLLEKMEDLQLAMIVARLYEADFENSSTCQGLLYEKVLGCNRDGSGYHCSRLHPDPFLRSIAYWIMKDYTLALDTLLERIPKEDDENPDVMVKSCNPVVFSFYNYLRTHPLIIRRHFANPEGTATTVGLTVEKSSADEINLIERKLFFTTANAHFKVGCPVLALEVLSKIPKITKKSGSSPLSKASSKANLNSSQPMENGTQEGLDWGSPAPPAPAWGGSDSGGGLDWSQPMVKVEEDELKLDWEDDKGDDEDDDDGDDDDDDAFLSDTQMTEHLDPNSYSWALIRLVMVKLAHHNVKNFLPLTGLDFTDLPVTSPLGNAVLKTLESWEQLLLERMNKFDGPPPNYINTFPTDLSAGGGPAILRHKAMLEPDNTPFKTKNHLSFPARRLWHFLVKQDILQETLIRYIFTKKRKQSESVENHTDHINPNCVAGARSPSKVEADLGYPGGKAKIIHKESDIIMAFAINKANSNEIVLASTHDVQEVDVSSLVAVQPFTWIGDDFDKESRSSDDVDYRSSHTNIAQASSVPFAPPQMPVSASMPWLGSGQTSMGASVIMKRNLNNVKRMTSHPIYQYYMTGAQDGSVRMFEWNRPQQLICFRQAGNARVTRLYFNSQGNKCGVADGEGFLSLWQVNQTSSNPKPYLSWQCHTKTCGDFAFITSSSLIATAGQSSDNRNVCLWDTLISPSNTMVHAFPCHENGATVLQYAPKQQLLITGGRKGFVCVFDIRQRQLLHTFQAHDSAIKALALDAFEDFFVTGSAEGNMKVWKLAGHGLMHSFSTEHAKQSIFRNIGAGVMQVETRPGNRIFTCGADGTLKMRVLPDRYSIPSSLVDIL
ncbi:dmX-like protein 2 isoform X6 [Nelusetta ayraudi]|uniref:dmX-like protein 2 isoform X6 n=1 Tax=Nelusetta ayraudi TaxID=303726 RepID=UPI003F71B5E8